MLRENAEDQEESSPTSHPTDNTVTSEHLTLCYIEKIFSFSANVQHHAVA